MALVRLKRGTEVRSVACGRAQESVYGVAEPRYQWLASLSLRLRKYDSYFSKSL